MEFMGGMREERRHEERKRAEANIQLRLERWESSDKLFRSFASMCSLQAVWARPH